MAISSVNTIQQSNPTPVMNQERVQSHQPKGKSAERPISEVRPNNPSPGMHVEDVDQHATKETTTDPSTRLNSNYSVNQNERKSYMK